MSWREVIKRPDVAATTTSRFDLQGAIFIRVVAHTTPANLLLNIGLGQKTRKLFHTTRAQSISAHQTLKMIVT